MGLRTPRWQRINGEAKSDLAKAFLAFLWSSPMEEPPPHLPLTYNHEHRPNFGRQRRRCIVSFLGGRDTSLVFVVSLTSTLFFFLLLSTIFCYRWYVVIRCYMNHEWCAIRVPRVANMSPLCAHASFLESKSDQTQKERKTCDFVYSSVIATVVKNMMSCFWLSWLIALNVHKLVWGDWIAHINVDIEWIVLVIVFFFFSCIYTIVLCVILVDISKHIIIPLFWICIIIVTAYISFMVSIGMNTFCLWLLYGFDDAIWRQLQLLSTTVATIAIVTTYVHTFFCGCYTHREVLTFRPQWYMVI